MVNVICPFCCMSNTVSESLVGSSVQCKSCGTKFTAEHPTGVPAAAQAAKASDLPSLYGGSAKKQKIGRYVAIAGGAIALLLVYMFIIHPMIFPSQPHWTKYYISQDAMMVSYINVENILDSDIYREFGEDSKKGTFTDACLGNISIGINQIKDMLVVVDMPNEYQTDVHIVLQLKDNISLAAFPGTVNGNKTHRQVEYIEIASDQTDDQTPSTLFLAKMGEHTFCVTKSETHLQKIIEQVKNKKVSPLPKELKEAMDAVSDHDSFMVMYPHDRQTRSDIISTGIGLTIDSSIRTKNVSVFTGVHEAKEYYDRIKSERDFFIESISNEGLEETPLGLMFKNSFISNDKSVVCVGVTFHWDDLRKLAKFPFEEDDKFSQKILSDAIESLFIEEGRLGTEKISEPGF